MLTSEPDLRELIDDASHRLLNTAGKLADEDVTAPALHCPGWTRGHVLTHIARSGDARR
ncbi:maleylpyruvate isomerase N-terminal domain-containing protein [Parasphingorhabdus pacifica]